MKKDKEIPKSARINNELKQRNETTAAKRKKVSDIVMPTKEPPKMVGRMIELLADLNLQPSEVDEKMMEEFPHLKDEGWKIGTTRKKLKSYPMLARSVKEAKALLWREVGLSRKDAYQVIADATKAEKKNIDGSIEPDHKIRMDATDRFLNLNGENPRGTGGTNISVGGGDNKIMIITSSGQGLSDAV
jgi:hypothetical protein